MSSVTRFLRQIPQATTYYGFAAAPAFYEFVPEPANYVGNYPPGVVAEREVDLPAGAILRDMGKTIKATGGDVDPLVFNYYRQVQVLVPAGFTAASLIGGANGTTSGVIGAPATPSGYAPYYTLYVKVAVAGLGVAIADLYPIAGGQM